MAVAPRPNTAVRLLLVDADAAQRRALRTALESRIARPLDILETAEPDAARALIAERAVDALAADLGTVGGPSGLRRLIERAPSLVTYALGAAANVKDAVAAVQVGAADFIEKPVDGPAFARRIERQFSLESAGSAVEVPTEGRAMRALADQIARIAPSAAPVFVFGAPGTGKAGVARAVHERSRRRGGPFVTVDCVGRESDDLLAALGAPGGAFDMADGGTLFLDEIGDLPDAVQALLLRPSRRARSAVSRTGAPWSARSSCRPTGRPPPAGAPAFAPTSTIVSPSSPWRCRRSPSGARTSPRSSTTWPAAPPVKPAGAHCASPPRPASASSATTAGQPARTAQRDRATVRHGRRRGHRRARDRRAARAGRVRLDRAGGATGIRPLWVEEAALIERAIAAFGGNIARAAAALEISPSTIYRKRRPAELQAAV